MPPNRALTVGKVYVSINNCPEAGSCSPSKYLVVKVCGAYGWTFEFTVCFFKLTMDLRLTIHNLCKMILEFLVISPCDRSSPSPEGCILTCC